MFTQGKHSSIRQIILILFLSFTRYESVLHEPTSNVVTVPYIDFHIKISVVTFCRAVLQER